MSLLPALLIAVAIKLGILVQIHRLKAQVCQIHDRLAVVPPPCLVGEGTQFARQMAVVVIILNLHPAVFHLQQGNAGVVAMLNLAYLLRGNSENTADKRANRHAMTDTGDSLPVVTGCEV